MTSVVDQNAGRPARQIQWSAGIQREIIRDLVVDVAYVGNRGAWWLSSTLDNYNALTPQILSAVELDIDITDPTDRAILTSTIGSERRRPIPDQLPYPGFPITATVPQALRPFPQFSSGSGASVGARRAHMVRFASDEGHQAALAWPDSRLRVHLGQGGTVRNRGAARSTTTKTACRTRSISGFSRPLVSAISATYSTPGMGTEQDSSWAADGGWIIGTVLQIRRADLPILVPTSTNNLSTLLFRSTFFNRVPGQPLYLDGFELPLHRSHSEPGAEPGGVGQSQRRPMGQFRALLQRFPV